MSYVGPLIRDLLDSFSKELKKRETKDKIMTNLIDPIVSEFIGRYAIYIYCFIITQLTIIILLIYIIYNVKKK